MARYIFITGGVVSSLGKGLAAAALGALLQAREYGRFRPTLALGDNPMHANLQAQAAWTDRR